MLIQGAIINVVSFNKNKQTAINTIFNQGLWGLPSSTKNKNCYKILGENTPVLLYGDGGLFVAAHIKEKFVETKKIPYWDKSDDFHLRFRLKLINHKVEGIIPISRKELIDFGVSLAKTGFMGYSIVLFGDELKKKGVSYPSEIFQKIWKDFLDRNEIIFSNKF